MDRLLRWRTIGGCDGAIAESDRDSAWINQVMALSDQVRFTVNLHVTEARRIKADEHVIHWVDETFEMPFGPPPAGGLTLSVQIDGKKVAPELGGRRSGGGVNGETDELFWELGLNIKFQPVDRLVAINLEWPKAALQGRHVIDLDVVRTGLVST